MIKDAFKFMNNRSNQTMPLLEKINTFKIKKYTLNVFPFLLTEAVYSDSLTSSEIFQKNNQGYFQSIAFVLAYYSAG